MPGLQNTISWQLIRLCVLIILLLGFEVHAQVLAPAASDSSRAEVSKTRRPLSVTVALFNHAVSMPSHRMFKGPLHPGLQSGVEGRYFENDRTKLFQTLNMGVYYNRYNGTGIYLNSEFAYRYTSGMGVFAEALIGIGYVRVYHPTDIYKLNDLGVYEKTLDRGFSSSLVSGAIGLGYSMKSRSIVSFSPFVRYEIRIQTRYSPDVPALPQTAFHVGVRINKNR